MSWLTSIFSGNQNSTNKFASYVLQATASTKKEVESQRVEDNANQQKGIFFATYGSWKNPATEQTVTLSLSNLSKYNVMAYRDPFSYASNNNFFFVADLIAGKVDLRSASKEQRDKLIDIFSTQNGSLEVVWAPCNGEEGKGLLNLISVVALNAADYSEESKFSEKLNSIHKQALEWKEKVNKIFEDKQQTNSSDSLNNEQTSDDTDSVSMLKGRIELGKPQPIYNSAPAFVSALAKRIEAWKAFSTSHKSTEFSSVYTVSSNVMYARNFNQANSSGFETITCVLWDSENPDSINLRDLGGTVIANPTMGVKIESLVNTFPSILAKLQRAVHPLFDGTLLSSVNLSNSDNWIQGDNVDVTNICWYFWNSRTVSLKPPFFSTFLEKFLIEIFYYMPNFWKIENSMGFKNVKSLSLKAESNEKTSSVKSVEAVSSEKWQAFSTSFIKDLRSFTDMLEQSHIIDLPQKWSFATFNYSQQVGHIQVRGVPNYYQKDSVFIPAGNWAEITAPLTEVVDFGSFTEEQREKLNQFLYEFSAENTYKLSIRMLEVDEDPSPGMKKVVFGLYSPTPNITDDHENNVQNLNAVLSNFDSNFKTVQQKLLEVLPTATKGTEEKEFKFNESALMFETEEKYPTFSGKGLDDLTGAFNRLALQNKSGVHLSFILTGFTEKVVWGQFILMYDQLAPTYTLRRTLINPLPFVSLTKEIEEKFWEFSSQRSDPSVAIVNDYGQPSTDAGYPAYPSLVTTLKLSVEEEDKEKAILEFLEKSNAVDASFI